MTDSLCSSIDEKERKRLVRNQRRVQSRISRRSRSLEDYLKDRLLSLRGKARAKGIAFDLDPSWLEGEILANGGCCSRTLVPFSWTYPAGPRSPSFDRIDPKKGYTKDNVQITTFMYNTAKNSFTHEDVVEMARSLLCQP